MAAMGISLCSPIIQHPQMLNVRFVAKRPRIVRFSFLHSQGRIFRVKRLSLLSRSSLLVTSQNTKIFVPYAMNTPMEGLSKKLKEIRNTPMENIPIKLWEMCLEPVRNIPWKEACVRVNTQMESASIKLWEKCPEPVKVACDRVIKNTQIEKAPIKLWEMCPEPVRNFPWNKACKRAVEHFFDLILDVAKFILGVTKQYGIPILLVTFLMEAWYCIAQNKELLIPVALFSGAVCAQILNETAIELELDQNPKEGDIPQYCLIIMLFFSLFKILLPLYPYWGRIILPLFATGGFCQTLWLAKDFLYKSSSQTTEAEPTLEGIQDQTSL